MDLEMNAGAGEELNKKKGKLYKTSPRGGYENDLFVEERYILENHRIHDKNRRRAIFLSISMPDRGT